MLIKHRKEWKYLEDKEILSKQSLSYAEKELEKLKVKSNNNPNEPQLKDEIKNAESKIHYIEKNQATLKAKISKENKIIDDLQKKKDELIKKSLIKLHAKIKKDRNKLNEDHDKYVKLYQKAREERHILESKMMNLRLLIYKNYKVRLI